MKTTVVLALAAVLAAGCTATPIADIDLGLSKGSVFDVPTPPAVKPNERAPGEGPLVPRSYLIAPPRIPHAVADFLPITRAENACLDCHGGKEKKPGEPTPIPPSHYTDYRRTPDRVAEKLAGARYVCVSCHAARTDAPSLMGNRFRP